MGITAEKLIRDAIINDGPLVALVPAERIITGEPEDETMDIEGGPFIIITPVEYTEKDTRSNTGTGVKTGDLVLNLHLKSWSSGKDIQRKLEVLFEGFRADGGSGEENESVTGCRFESSSEIQLKPGWQFSQIFEVKVQNYG